LSTRGPDRSGDRLAQRSDVVGFVVGQVGVLGVVPDLLHGIEFGRISGQPFDLDLPREASQKSLGTGTMPVVQLEIQDAIGAFPVPSKTRFSSPPRGEAAP